RGVEKGQTDRARGRLEAKIAGRETNAFAIDDFERHGGPAPRADIGWAGRVPFVRQLDAHDARGAHGERHRRGAAVEPQGRSAPREPGWDGMVGHCSPWDWVNLLRQIFSALASWLRLSARRATFSVACNAQRTYRYASRCRLPR